MLQLVQQSPFTEFRVEDLMWHLNVVDESQMPYLGTLLEAAVTYCERETQMDFRSTQWNLILDQFPYWWPYGDPPYAWPQISEVGATRYTQRWQAIILNRGPIRSVNSITYFDTANAQQTVDPTTYAYATPSYAIGVIEPVQVWPIAYSRPDAVTVNFTTGLSPVPANILHAVKMLAGSWYAMREDMAYGPGTVNAATGTAVQCLLAQVKGFSYS